MNNKKYNHDPLKYAKEGNIANNNDKYLKRAAPATMPTSVPEGTCEANKGEKKVNGTHFPLLVTYY